ncbi:MAG: ATP-dependent RecD-like DNA helicase [Oscillospiraceae bacterium]|nr:ATP-dependent RecD-like DNA helicase [Oscillospiraceae bacterium]
MRGEKNRENLIGRIDSVVYRSDDTGYAVLRVDIGEADTETVVGCIPYAAPGEMINATGFWSVHPSHGRQFKVEACSRKLPDTAESIYDFLCAGCIKGIGPGIAALIVNRFSANSLNVIENYPERLAEIKGISKQKANEISAAFRKDHTVRRLSELMCENEISPIFALRLYKYYGTSAYEVLCDDPYILASESIGGNFFDADRLAVELGFDGDSVSRISAAITFELQHNSNNGHCFIPRNKLIAATAQLISLDEDDVRTALEDMLDCGELICEAIGGVEACYLSRLYEAETYTAKTLLELVGSDYADEVNIEQVISSIEEKTGLHYAPAQRQAITYAAEHRVLAVTGGPGTGKTTCVQAIIALYEKMGLKVFLTAPTGRAAKRLSELSGKEAQTIHRLLGAAISEDGETVEFRKNAKNPLECDAVIVDECSMVDIVLMKSLLEAMRPSCRLILVGDADQLPSVGPGKVFEDIIASNIIPAVRLTEIFRQDENSRIIRYAHMINKGEHPRLRENAGDFFMMRRKDAASSAETIVDLFSRRLPEKMGHPMHEIQVLSATRAGEMGTVALNKRLQAAANPPHPEKNEKQFGEVLFREGDKIMQIRNNYDILWHKAGSAELHAGIYNGDMGYIRRIDNQAGVMEIDFDGRYAVYTYDLLNELEHAWAITVHKSQGSEYPAVILALGGCSKKLLTRGVLYTAVSRAKKLLVGVGNEEAAYYMIDNYVRSRRYSGLRLRLVHLADGE